MLLSRAPYRSLSSVASVWFDSADAAHSENIMNNRNIPYWITTALFAFALTGSGIMAITRQPQMMAGFEHLGYPAYLLTILGAWKLLGVVALISPGLPRLKEWAYAGFVFNLTGAIASHLAVGDAPGQVVAPVLLLALLAASWKLRPSSRSLAAPGSDGASSTGRPALA